MLEMWVYLAILWVQGDDTDMEKRRLDTAGTEQFSKFFSSLSSSHDAHTYSHKLTLFQPPWGTYQAILISFLSSAPPFPNPHSHFLFRELYMKTGQGFLLVFSITSQSSLNELSELRETIIRIKDDENVPIVIVGNKSDLEQDRVVSRQAAFNVSQSWGNAPYYETSARRRGEFFSFPFSLPFSLLGLIWSWEWRMKGRWRKVGMGDRKKMTEVSEKPHANENEKQQM